MYQNLFKTIVLLFFLSGCAERVIDISDKEGKIVGGCNAGFDWHFYGLQDSIDYVLYECAKDLIAKGYTISDERLLSIDFSLPDPPKGQSWNKKLAMIQFHSGKITERKLGYILAATEFQYIKIIRTAKGDLASGKMTESEFNKIDQNARLNWLGE
ncbi:hypothetical protein A3Q34_18825 [Colwellia sp. PAMC 20917]|uniref:hypothetical protein n=1 Tax=Colwellia sp. PAMC 20917 TaxID=1816218 RepID=UPI0008790115|nr:hypothetical protein [Colwellia sp. PAMC 20917]AOW78708.1 hypothetical protein A3Q34_18825 [Colwellia sp. PAMC 20917]